MNTRKSPVVEGSEAHYIRRILARDTDEITLMDRIAAAYFIQSYYFRNVGTFLTYQIARVKEHDATWRALGSDHRMLLRQLIDGESCVTGEANKGQAQLSHAYFRLWTMLTVVITLVVVMGAFKLFGM